MALEVHPGLTHVTAYDRNLGRAREMLSLAGDRVTRAASSPTDAVSGADLVITTITVPLDPKLDCSNTDPNALLLPGRLRRCHVSQRRLTTRLSTASTTSAVRVGGRHPLLLRPAPTDTHLAAVVSGEYEVPVTGRRAFLNMGNRDGRRGAQFAGARPCHRRGCGPLYRIPLVGRAVLDGT